MFTHRSCETDLFCIALLVVGDMETLSEGDSHWASFVKWCLGVRCIVDDTESGDECDSV